MSATVSRSTSSPSFGLFRSNATTTSSSYRAPLVRVLRTASSERGNKWVSSGGQESYAPSLLRKPAVSPPPDHPPEEKEPREVSRERGGECDESDDDNDDDHDEDRDEWSDWENRILEETVPLVGFVRTIIHSGKYKIGDTLSPEHQNIILERLLPYHPQYEEKIGCGVESITVGFHTEFKQTRCLFIVRKDGERIDFSYWKCIKGLIRKKYPLHADAFIFRHFRRRKRDPST